MRAAWYFLRQECSLAGAGTGGGGSGGVKESSNKAVEIIGTELT